MTFRELEKVVVENGFRVSAWSYEDSKCISVQSVEIFDCGFCHPKFVACFDKETGWVKITGKKEFKIS